MQGQTPTLTWQLLGDLGIVTCTLHNLPQRLVVKINVPKRKRSSEERWDTGETNRSLAEQTSLPGTSFGEQHLPQQMIQQRAYSSAMTERHFNLLLRETILKMERSERGQGDYQTLLREGLWLQHGEWAMHAAQGRSPQDFISTPLCPAERRSSRAEWTGPDSLSTGWMAPSEIISGIKACFSHGRRCCMFGWLWLTNKQQQDQVGLWANRP